MALTVNTNISGLTAQNALIRSKNEMDEAMERLATGMRINSGGDDASGLSISTRMESQIRAIEASVKNAADGISLVQTAEGALNEITHMLQRMRELAVQASSGIPNAQDRLALDAEVQSLKEEIDRIAGNTIFNDNILFDGSFRTVVQTGPRVHEFVDVTIPNLTTDALGSLTKTATTRAVTNAIFDGKIAQPTVTQLTFDGSDTYRFALTVEIPKEPGGDVYEYTYNISGVVASGSAVDIAKDINEQLRSIPLKSSEVAVGTATTSPVATAADAIRVTLQGNAITLQNMYGGDIRVDAGQFDKATGQVDNTGVNQMADASSRIRFTSVKGGESSTNVVLGSDPFAKTTLTNIGGSGTSVTSAEDTTPSALKFQFVNQSASTHSVVAAISSGDTVALTLVDELGGETLIFTDQVNGLSGTAGIVSALNNALIASGADQTYAITADASNPGGFVITREDGIDFTLKLGGSDGQGNALTSSFANTNSEISGSLGLRLTPVDLATTGVSFKTADDDITIRFASDAAGSFGASPVLGQSDGFSIRLTDTSDGQVHNLTIAGLVNGSASTVAAALTTAIQNAGISDQYQVVAEAGDFASSGITITHKLGDSFKLEFTDLTGVSNASTLVIHEKLDDLNFDATVDEALFSTNGVVDGSPTTVVTPQASVMFLDPLGHDTYKFKFASDAAGTTKTSEITVRYDGSASSLDKFASYVNTYINTLQAPANSGVTYDFDVAVEGGRIKITENNGNGFTITDFVSDGAGKVVASVPNGQGANGVNAVVLDDTVFETTAVTKTITDAQGADVGLVDPTEITLDFNGNDTYAFRISDGSATAVINPFKYTGGDVPNSQGEIVSAINVALKTAGLDGVMKAEQVANSDKVKITHVLGNRVTIEGFDSLDAGTILVEGTSGATGVATYLDDDTGATGKVIANVSIDTASDAQDALDVISRALEDINMQRAQFGAIENRLEYTINNLSNIAMNTAAAKSRIEDADYAKESAKLAKTQVLQQAGTAILAQANMTSQQVLQLLNG
jgi:flagellin